MSALPFMETIAQAFRTAAPSLPGAGAVSAQRQAALEAFRRFGVPNHRLESWKFTSLSGLEKQTWALPANEAGIDAARVDAAALAGADSYRLVFVNGRFDAAASRLDDLPKGVILSPLSGMPDDLSEVLAGETDKATALAALNAALASDGVVLRLADGVVLEKPVELIAFGAPALVNLRHMIVLGRGASATLVETYRDGGIAAPGWTNIVGRIELGEGANLAHIRLQAEGASAYHAALARISVGGKARYVHRSLQTGGAVARHELHTEFAGSDAAVDIQGLTLARGSSHIDHTLFLHHAVPGCRSNQLFKHIVDDRGHAVFQGGIRVAPHAQKTDAQQLSRTLLLADRAQVDTKPELEILADDVKCSHGASIGDLDPQQMFYMQARGIGAEDARRLLLGGFAYEIIAAVPEGSLRDRICDVVEGWLQGGAA
ncbi:MAG TPA: Fe-S cluster assembly protein SufD [Ferrovibrio sp.]|jgi:Fe-S cluster assembly protein SufD|uniref:Fe-S cluster assembly protein SufD n=1 Tax=Ferrovibrio sp. TaxID=1917215 RepID=UPI002ED195F4